MAQKRVNWIDTIEEIASEQWGRDVDDPERMKMEIANSPDKLTAYSILAILRRITQAQPRKDYFENPDIELRGDHGTFPDAKIGDALWRGSIDEGFYQLIVVGKDSEGHCRVAPASDEDGTYRYQTVVGWAWGDSFLSLREAVAHSAKSDIEYYEKHLNIARKALAACEAGDDLSEYIEGVG